MSLYNPREMIPSLEESKPPLTVSRESRPPRRKFRLPSKTKMIVIITATVLVALAISRPISTLNAAWAAAWAFGATYVEGIFGDSTVTTSEVQSVIFEEIIANEVLGEATGKITLYNVKVQIDESDILGLGSESLTVPRVQVRARATVGAPFIVVDSGEGFKVILPGATLDEVYMLVDEEILVERDRNIVTRLGDLVGGVTPEQLVRDEIARAGQEEAEASTDLLRRAEEAAVMNITNRLSEVGANIISVTFDR